MFAVCVVSGFVQSTRSLALKPNSCSILDKGIIVSLEMIYFFFVFCIGEVSNQIYDVFNTH